MIHPATTLQLAGADQSSSHVKPSGSHRAVVIIVTTFCTVEKRKEEDDVWSRDPQTGISLCGNDITFHLQVSGDW